MRSGLVYILLMFMLSKVSYGQVDLTAEEKKWLAEHPVIKVANEDDWPPFDYSEKGKALGLSISYVNLLVEKLGIKAEYINGHSWNELLDLSKNFEVDLMPCIWYADNRTDYLNFTSSYINNPQVIVVNKKNKSITKTSDLRGKKVAFIKDYATKDQILEAFPEIIPVPVSSPLEALLLVNLGSADACIDSLGLVSYQIGKNLLSGLKIVGNLEMEGVENVNNLYMAVRKDWPLLHSALEKAMNSLTEEEKLDLHDKWLVKIEADSKGEFKVLPSERKWLATQDKIRFGYNGNMAPVQYHGLDKSLKGIVGEYVSSIENSLEKRFSLKHFQDIDTAIEDLKNRKIDIVSTMIKGGDESLVYSDPLISIPIVVVTRTETGLLVKLEALKGKPVGFIGSSGVSTKISDVVQLDDVSFFTNIDSAFDALEEGQIDAFCGDLASITYKLKKTGDSKLGIALSTALFMDVGFAMRKDWNNMATILNRYIASITQQKKMDIEHRWYNVFIEKSFSWLSYWKEFLIVGTCILLLFAVFIFWNRSLSKEIEQRQLVEDSLVKARQQAEKSDQAKSEFLAMMSHEIRTPLNGIIGMSELLSDSGLNSEQKKECSIILSSGKSLLTIINDILDFSKIEAGKMSIEKHPFNLTETLESVISLYQNSASTKGLFLNLAVDSKIFGSYIGDEGRLKQVLLNLVSNAIKFTSEGGVIVKADLLKSEAKRETLKIEIQDTGIGIPEDAQNKLFQKFSQADTSTTRKYGGTGLGLAISKRIVDLMNGSIYLQSENGKGSSFIIEIMLPKASTKVGLKQQKELETLSGQKLNVLLAEDNIVNQKIAVKVLSKVGCEVTVAENGLVALEKLSKMKPDIIFMDCHMPELDGYQTTIEIRKNEKYNTIPIVAMTANALQGDKEKCLDVGMNDYISKPIDKGILMGILKKYSKSNS